MKHHKKMLTASLLIATSYAGIVAAHNQSGLVGTIASGKAATDAYQVTCSNDGNGAPARLVVQVADLGVVAADKKATLVSTQIIHPQTATASKLSEDAVDGDAIVAGQAGGFSPLITLVGGTAAANQNYIVTVNKQLTASTVAAQKGIENYNLQLHCQTATGTHTGTNWIQTQNY